MTSHDDLRKALLQSDPILSKYNPLERILSVDNFDTGQHGWAPYFPDYDGATDYEHRYPYVEPLDQILERTRQKTIDDRMDRRYPIGKRAIPQVSNLPTWDVGTFGSWDTYALKIPTLPRVGEMGVGMKRLNTPWNAKFRVETYFTYKAEASDYQLGERDIRAFFLSFDVHDPAFVRETGAQPRRWWPGVRYHNVDEDGELVQKWQMMLTGSWGTHDGPWDYLDDGWQELGFNRAPTKYQWNYFRFTIDLANYEYVDFNCSGKEFDVKGLKHIYKPQLPGWRASTDKTHGLVLPSFGIETNSNKRVALYLDSIVISASES